MKVLWLCNIVLPVIARQLNMEGSNKEGWVSGLAEALLGGQPENGVELSVAFPIRRNALPGGSGIFGKGQSPQEQSLPGKFLPVGGASKKGAPGGIFKGFIPTKSGTFTCYGFPEDVDHAERYDEALEESMRRILEEEAPDIVHCFGTEYPHTLAMCRIFPRKDRLLVGLQGLCSLLAEAYYADLPKSVVHSATLRDWLRRDSLTRQREKFAARGRREREVIGLAGNITGRTRWDRENTERWNPAARYHHLDEILRPEFYGPVWKEENCIPHSIFMSQGDYPLKGLHYMLAALPTVLDVYPDAKVYVAGGNIVRCGTFMERLKLSAYGRYLLRLVGQMALEERVVFLGRLDAEQMRDRYLVSHLYVCASSLENSPNSLGEAMLLGMPCVSAAVGGIPSLFTGGEDGVLYEGFQKDGEEEGALERVAERLADAVTEIWGNPEKMRRYCENARNHAGNTHDRDRNYRRLMEIYHAIVC